MLFVFGDLQNPYLFHQRKVAEILGTSYLLFIAINMAEDNTIKQQSKRRQKDTEDSQVVLPLLFV